MSRSSRADVRNPILSLPSMSVLADLPDESRRALVTVLTDISRDAAARAERSWHRKKAPMAVYWKAVSVYAKHIGRAIRSQEEPRCGECGARMARFAGPGDQRGWICVTCADPEEIEGK